MYSTSVLYCTLLRQTLAISESHKHENFAAEGTRGPLVPAAAAASQPTPIPDWLAY